MEGAMITNWGPITAQQRQMPYFPPQTLNSPDVTAHSRQQIHAVALASIPVEIYSGREKLV
jgi:hypothetical protein